MTRSACSWPRKTIITGRCRGSLAVERIARRVLQVVRYVGVRASYTVDPGNAGTCPMLFARMRIGDRYGPEWRAGVGRDPPPNVRRCSLPQSAAHSRRLKEVKLVFVFFKSTGSLGRNSNAACKPWGTVGSVATVPRPSDHYLCRLCCRCCRCGGLRFWLLARQRRPSAPPWPSGGQPSVAAPACRACGPGRCASPENCSLLL
jgi:hypothetical protein